MGVSIRMVWGRSIRDYMKSGDRDSGYYLIGYSVGQAGLDIMRYTINSVEHFGMYQLGYLDGKGDAEEV